MDIRMIALLRGINVGTSKRVAMADLRTLLLDLGYTDVTTVLNSGNAAFSCPAGAAPCAGVDIERGLVSTVGVDCRVLARTATDFRSAVTRAPLLDLVTDPSRYFVGFLAEEPGADAADLVARQDAEAGEARDRVRLLGRELYLWCPAGLLASPLGKHNWDRTLGTAVTMRNWRTVTKLGAVL